MTSCAHNSPSHRRGFKLCSILWSPSIKIPSFKCNLRQCLDLISLFPMLLPGRFTSQMILLLIYQQVLILSRKYIESSVKLLILTPHTSRLRTQTRYVTPISCDLEPGITKSTSRNIFISADMDPDLSDGLDSGRAIAWVSC